MTTTTRRTLTLALLFVALATLRLLVAAQFSTSSPDGDQYYALSQSLLNEGRLAFKPAPAPLTHSRMPGYPVFLAAIDTHAQPRQAHVARAALANAILDLGTAMLVWLLLRQFRTRVRVLAVLMVALSPTLILMSVCALSESLATFLTMLAVWSCYRLRMTDGAFQSVVVGLTLGVALLVRIDTISVLPAIVIALLASRAPRRNTALLLTSAIVVFAAWPLRNLARFGNPYFAATELPSQEGEPLPTGIITWTRTWSDGAPGDSNVIDMIVFGRRFNGQGVLHPKMYDSPSERETLLAIFDDFEKRGMTTEVSGRFARLGHDRMLQHPFRTFVILPCKRIVHLLSAPPAPSIHFVRIPVLGLPTNYWMFPGSLWVTYALAVVGTIALWRRRERLILALVSGPIIARVVLHAFAVPHQVSYRYFSEALPLLIVLAAASLSWRAPPETLKTAKSEHPLPT